MDGWKWPEEFCKDGGELRKWLDKFVNRIVEREKAGIKSGLFVGEEITIAELKFAGLLYGMRKISDSPNHEFEFGSFYKVLDLEKYKPLRNVVDIVYANEKIKKLQDEVQKNVKESGITIGDKEVKEVVFKYGGKYIYIYQKLIISVCRTQLYQMIYFL